MTDSPPAIATLVAALVYHQLGRDVALDLVGVGRDPDAAGRAAELRAQPLDVADGDLAAERHPLHRVADAPEGDREGLRLVLRQP